MSILIDDLIDLNPKENMVELVTISRWGRQVGWYIAKPLPFYSIGALIGRIGDAWRVLNDKSRAYHYKEDE